MKNVVFEADDIHGGYGKIVIVQGISIQLKEGELVAMVGPNGSGKSTFIKSIYGLATLFRGKVFFNGADITRLNPEEKSRLGIGYVPQVNNVFPDLKVEENLEMGAYSRNDKSQIRKDMEEIFNMFPLLYERRDQKAATLSGGERQMLAVARSLMARPTLLLLDEPAPALAPKIVTELFKKIKEIKDAGTPILLVEQHARRALEIADRGYVLVAGRKVMEGTGHEILSNKDLKSVFLGKK